MNEFFRLRPSPIILRFLLYCIALFAASLTAFSADYPAASVRHQIKGSSPTTVTASIALFERDDLPRAAKLAQREILRSSRNVNAWFISMEVAALRQDEKRELRSALAVCKLARDGDPRAILAAMRLSEFGQNSEDFREARTTTEKIADGESACAPAALQSLYAASLDGLPQTNVRDLARRSGWLTQWTITRAGAAAAKITEEQFEFVDARVVLPDYLPRAANYVADATYVAPHDGEYVVSGDLAGTRVAIDDQDTVPGPAKLSAGPHRVQVTFRAAEEIPRIRLLPAIDADKLRWENLNLPDHEIIYLRAIVSLARGNSVVAAEQIQDSCLAATTIGLQLIAYASRTTARQADFESALSHPSCGNLKAALSTPGQAASMADRLQSCAPDSLAYARWLANANRHTEAIHELARLIQEWPLDREAHRMLIAELQRCGDDHAADRAAAAFLAIAPNARNFRRMAQSATASAHEEDDAPFYAPYRRPAPAPLSAFVNPDTPAVILLQDKVAISRLDGSVSLYVHRVVQLMTATGAEDFHPLSIPDGGQLLTARVVNREHALPSSRQPGDEIEEEYVVHFTGDGGMISHPEAFQYVFNDFDDPLLDARFVVLSPATQSPGYIIASGDVPPSRVAYTDTLRAQIWEKQSAAADANPAIIRVVENENGWSIPPSIERRRNLDTIHPGPRPREA